MTRAELLRLAERVKAVTGPDQNLDVAVFEALGWSREEARPGYWLSPDKTTYRQGPPPAFTGSVDAVVSITPPGWEVRICSFHEGGSIWKWSVEATEYKGDNRVCVFLRPTEALARLEIALRALAYQLEEGLKADAFFSSLKVR